MWEFIIRNPGTTVAIAVSVVVGALVLQQAAAALGIGGHRDPRDTPHIDPRRGPSGSAEPAEPSEPSEPAEPSEPSEPSERD